MNTTELSLTIGSPVRCEDGRSGKLSGVIINPSYKKLTNVIIHHGYVEHLVPTANVVHSSSASVTLACNKYELDSMLPVSSRKVYLFDHYFDGEYFINPVTMEEYERSLADAIHIPMGEIPIRRCNKVFDSKGKIGSVFRFVIDRKTNVINHIWVHGGNLRHKYQVKIPACAIVEISHNSIILNLSIKRYQPERVNYLS